VLGSRGRLLSYCIAGHHAGLADWSDQLSSLQNRLANINTQNIAEQYRNMFCQFLPQQPPWRFETGLDVSLWMRMLFSCLIDADRLDTERYMDPTKNIKRQGYQTIAELVILFQNVIYYE
jgi:CRISPR-associated endonuclease/helicase Cas3